MIKVSELASELNLGEHEVRAVCKMAGIDVGNATTHINDADAQQVRDILAGRVAFKPPKVRKQMPPGATAKLLVVGGIVIALVTAIGVWANQPASITVRPGDCFDEPEIFGAKLSPVSCNGPHKYEAYAKMDLTAKFDVYPGRDEVEKHVRSRCEALRGNRGEEAFSLVFQIYYFFPEERAWDDGARSAICATRNW